MHGQCKRTLGCAARPWKIAPTAETMHRVGCDGLAPATNDHVYNMYVCMCVCLAVCWLYMSVCVSLVLLYLSLSLSLVSADLVLPLPVLYC